MVVLEEEQKSGERGVVVVQVKRVPEMTEDEAHFNSGKVNSIIK